LESPKVSVSPEVPMQKREESPFDEQQSAELSPYPRNKRVKSLSQSP